MSPTLKVFTDGGARGNPGPAAFGFVVKSDQKLIKEGNGYIGIATNNFAEYTAVIEALKYLKTNYPNSKVEVFLDSLLVVSQLNGVYKVKASTIRTLLFQVRELEAEFARIIYIHIPREQNSHADRLVNIALDNHGD